MQTRDGDGARSVADLTKDVSRQASDLVRKEMELAQAELTVKGKRAGAGAGAFGAAALLAVLALGALTAAAILALATFLDGWLAALIVAGVYLAVAGGLALAGKSKVTAATPPLPEQAIDSMKEDVSWTTDRARHARSAS